MIGLEAGQSAFGDVYAWFKELLSWPLKAILKNFLSDVGEVAGNLARETEALIMQRLAEEAAGIQPGPGTVLALDWLNGRCTPYADQRLTGAITGLTLGTSAPAVFRALVESTAFGSKAISDHIIKAGIPVKEVVALGGIAQKSDLVMQITADILGMPVKVVLSGQACALGAAMFASVAAGRDLSQRWRGPGAAGQRV
ncbi:MAG: FGGY-family carbohydrate kinase [Bacillota bacterium]